MNKERIFLPILLGTNRKGRESEKVAKWLSEKMSEREDVETKLFDVRDFDLPQDDYGTAIGKDFPEWCMQSFALTVYLLLFPNIITVIREV